MCGAEGVLAIDAATDGGVDADTLVTNGDLSGGGNRKVYNRRLVPRGRSS